MASKVADPRTRRYWEFRIQRTLNEALKPLVAEDSTRDVIVSGVIASLEAAGFKIVRDPRRTA